MLPLLKYSVMRLGLFVTAMGVLYLVGIQGLLLNLVAAGVISLLLSYLLLGRQREELSVQIQDRVSARLKDAEENSKIAEDAAIEDAAVEEALDRSRPEPKD